MMQKAHADAWGPARTPIEVLVDRVCYSMFSIALVERNEQIIFLLY